MIIFYLCVTQLIMGADQFPMNALRMHFNTEIKRVEIFHALRISETERLASGSIVILALRLQLGHTAVLEGGYSRT